MSNLRTCKANSPTHFRAVLGTQIRETRNALGMQQRDLAARTGLRPDRLSRYENGLQPPTVLALYKIAASLGRPVETLLPDLPFEIESDRELQRLYGQIWSYPEVVRAFCTQLLRLLLNHLAQVAPTLSAPRPLKGGRHASGG